MNTIPTAGEFFNKRLAAVTQEECNGKSPMMQVMIEFAKLHVEAALKAATENVEYTKDSAGNDMVDKESILNAYPLTNII